MAGSGREETARSVSNSREFQLDLISFALQAERLFLWHEVHCWSEFRSASQINTEEHRNKTPKELREYFMQQVLPEIYQYNLSDSEKSLLHLLSLHPGYQRTDDGFVKTQKFQTIDFERESGLAKECSLLPENANLNTQVAIAAADCISKTEKKLSDENAMFLSVILCPDKDLPVCSYLSTEEALKRLREAKTQFARTGRHVDNLRCSVEEVLVKLKTLCELKSVVTELLEKVLQ